MWKRYDSRVVFDSDDNSIGGRFVDDNKSIDSSDAIAELFDSADVGDILGDEDPDADAGESEDGGEKDDNNTDDVNTKVDPETKPAGEETGDVKVKPESVKPEVKPTDDIGELKSQVASLMATITEMKKSVQPVEDKVDDKKLELPSVDLATLFKDTDFDTVMESKEGFLKFLSEAMAAVQSNTVDTVLGSIPNMVGGVVNRQKAVEDIRTNFYGKYPELKNVKKYVVHAANEISSEDPNLTMEQVLEKAAMRIKEDFKLGSVEVSNGDKAPSTPPSKPSLPGATGVKTKQANVSKLQSEINDLIDD